MFNELTLFYQHFFEPNQLFFDWVESKNQKIIDCGSGTGLLPSLYPDKVVGIDITPREKYDGQVYIIDASIFPFDKSMICLIARPDHSGWIYKTIQNALSKEIEVFYVGLSKNIDCDLIDFEFVKILDDVGKDGEFLCQIIKEK